MQTALENRFHDIFYQGPNILFFINIITLGNQKRYLLYYIIFFILNEILNATLKGIIKQPRPIGYQNNYESGAIYKGVHLNYGMPSGHSQSSLFSLVFLWLVTKSPFLLVIESIICFFTLFQRWKNKKHSIEQLFVGGIIGSLIAYLTFMVCENAQRWI